MTISDKKLQAKSFVGKKDKSQKLVIRNIPTRIAKF
jgi:hypothetical protein